jgi:hypothetical protein
METIARRGGRQLKTLTLVTRRLYFGVDARRLREATERVLTRLEGLPTEHARVNLDALTHDFGWNPATSQSLAEQMIQGGLLQRVGPSAAEFGITDKFRRCAQARIVDPLLRPRAQLLLTHIADIARKFNESEHRNKYEIDSIAVHGAYMSHEDELTELALGVTGRRRPPVERPLFGRATVPTEGTDQIRALLEAPSAFVQVSFVQKLIDLPKPFSVVFKAD